jgi:acetyltransferase-like isoleucine patch superfamily enzyme
MLNPKAILRKSGAALRYRRWQLQLEKLGTNVDIQPTAHFEYASKISIGNHCRVARQAVIRANTDDTRRIRLGDKVSIQENTLISANRGHIAIGDNSWLGPGSVIYGNGGVDIGEQVLIASHCVINTVSHNFGTTDIPMNRQGINTDPVIIEDDVWIGTGAVILQGVRIGKGSIIGAGAVVTRSIPSFSIALGMPARVTGSRLETTKHQSPADQLSNVSNMGLR